MPLTIARRGVSVLRHLNKSNGFSRPVRTAIAQTHVRRISLAAHSRTLNPIVRNVVSSSILTKGLLNTYATASGTKKGTKKTTKASSKKSTKAVKSKKSAAKKKPLTDEQKEAKREKQKAEKSRQLLKDLKAAALTPPKKLPSSTWQVALTAKLREGKAPSNTVPQERFSQAAEQCRNLSSEETNLFNSVAESNKKANAEAFDQWLKSHTPLQIKEANHARRRLAQIQNKSAALLRDDRLVKRPMTSYLCFFQERLRDGDLKYMAATDICQRISEEWKALTGSEKAKYDELAREDNDRYIREYRDVYGEEPSYAKRQSSKSQSS